MVASHAGAQVIPANEYRRTRWKNGAGWTREICACRLDGVGGTTAVDWDWRLSIAEIEADAPFSMFPGIERQLVLLSGNGVRLRFADGEVRELQPPHEHLRFDGERDVTGELVAGRTEDFNLMWRRDTTEAELWLRPLVGTMMVFVEPGSTWALHVIGGGVRFQRETGLPDLAMGDTVLMRAGTKRTRYALDGAGEALLMQLAPRTQA